MIFIKGFAWLRTLVLVALLTAFQAQHVLARPVITIRGTRATISTSCYLARLDGGCLIYFKDKLSGEVLIDGTWMSPSVRFVERRSSVTASTTSPLGLIPRKIAPNVVTFAGQIQNGKSKVVIAIEVKALNNELVLTGHSKATGKFEGLASMSLPIASTMPHTELIVPTFGGNSYGSAGLRSPRSFEWPITWEAAMLQVHGKNGGLLICAFEPFKRFKNLHIAPASAFLPANSMDVETKCSSTAKAKGQVSKTGWNIILESENNAPFEGKRSVRSLEWRVRPYAGEWRNGASIYRDWHRRTFKPDPNEEPSWVRDIRAEIHCGTDLDVLDALVKAGVDPKQTLLYVSSWRAYAYDVNYPDYTPADHLAPFVKKAHELGFRVMLHVNHFGCDPKMPDYERFKRFHVKHRYSGELQWWDWPSGNGRIRFAYINPASREWRQFFVSKMKELIRQTGVDAVHLDQTLCIYNDRNGLIDGLNMAQGNLLLHKELKSALPNLVLSGEGLNEVTMIHESFAQRHVAGIDHVNRVWSRSALRETHPICAYLFGARTKPYDYLASGSPEDDQYRLAWRDAFRHWGVLPGFGWPNVKMVSEPSPSARQALDEIIAHQRNKLDPWIDGPWPKHVNFLYRSASGESFAYVSLSDGWALCRVDANLDPVEELVRVITGVRSAKVPGTIPGAICYDRERVWSLDPSRYYVYFPEPRDLSAFHLECEEEVGPVQQVCFGPKVTFAQLSSSNIFIDTQELISRANAYWSTPSGKRRPLTSEISERTGVVVSLRGSGLFMHPQWKGDGAGVGSAEVVFSVEVPRHDSAVFSAKCRLENGAEGKSDGVEFRAIAECGNERVETTLTAESSTPVNLSLPLDRFSGKRVSVRLIASAGPKRDSTFDWGIVDDLQVIVSSNDTRCKVVVPKWAKHLVAPVYWNLDLDASHSFPEGVKKRSISIPAGGVVMITSLDPTPIATTTKLSEIPQTNMAVTASSFIMRSVEESPITLAPAICGGVERRAIFAHPPDGGVRMLHYFVRPPQNTEFLLKTSVGLADGSKSGGVRFAVWLNGKELWSKRVMTGDGWIPVEVSLGKLTGDPVMLTLVTDPDGSHYYDWALWEDPVLAARL